MVEVLAEKLYGRKLTLAVEMNIPQCVSAKSKNMFNHRIFKAIRAEKQENRSPIFC
jgi:hypothetical protein